LCRAAQGSKTIHINDIASSALVGDQEKELWPEGRILVVPIPYQGQPVAVAVLHRSADSEDFTAADVKTAAELAKVMAPAILTAKLHHRQRCQIYGTLEAVADAVENRDPYLKGHSARVLAYAQQIATALELSQPQMGALQIAARLHDIGRIALPESAVNHLEPLTEEQRDIVQQHPAAGAEFLKPLEFLGEVGDIIRAHHESYDGTGYPDRKAGNEIPMVARILTVADTFDAMTSLRPHRQPLSLEEAKSHIRRVSGEQFDPQVVKAFLSLSDDVLEEIRDSRR
jgi:putative nucleotidyltransferase with HDIG domain